MAEGGGRAGRLLVLAVGVGALAVGAWQGVSTAHFLRHAVATPGRVLGQGGAGAMSRAHPTVAFRTAGGLLVRYDQDGMGARPVGATLPVLYDPAAPAATAVARGFWTLWFPTVGPSVLGVLFLLVVMSGAEVRMRGAQS